MNYREAYGMYACNGILFNHESPRRGETFVTRKITRVLARIDAGLEDCLYMGNLDSLRDWGHARDYVELQWRMLQQEGPPEDFVIATGRQESVRRFHEAAEANAPSVTSWGTGSPLREFLHVDDLGEACVFALEHWSPAPGELIYLNVSSGKDLSIRELAEEVAAATGFQGAIEWDSNQPDGTPKKQLDVSRLAALGWRARIPLAEGLTRTVVLFRESWCSSWCGFDLGWLR